MIQYIHNFFPTTVRYNILNITMILMHFYSAIKKHDIVLSYLASLLRKRFLKVSFLNASVAKMMFDFD